MIGDYTISPLKDQQFTFVESPKLICKRQWSEEKNCKGQIVVKGYDIKGTLKHDDLLMPNVHVFLYTKSSHPPNIYCNMPYIKNPLKQQHLCYTISNKKGEFSFKTLAQGKYFFKFISYDQKKQMTFNNQQIDFEIYHRGVEIQQNLDVKEFSISGKVIDS